MRTGWDGTCIDDMLTTGLITTEIMLPFQDGKTHGKIKMPERDMVCCPRMLRKGNLKFQSCHSSLNYVVVPCQKNKNS